LSVRVASKSIVNVEISIARRDVVFAVDPTLDRRLAERRLLIDLGARYSRRRAYRSRATSSPSSGETSRPSIFLPSISFSVIVARSPACGIIGPLSV